MDFTPVIYGTIQPALFDSSTLYTAALVGTAFLTGMALQSILRPPTAPAEPQKEREWTMADYLPKVQIIFHTHRPSFYRPMLPMHPFFPLHRSLPWATI